MIHRTKNARRAILPKNAFARGVSVLVGGTAGAQLITVLAAPLLTRLYGPEDFGLVAVYGSLLALIGVVSSLRYELAIPLPEDDVEAANVAVLSLLLVALTTVLSGVLVALLATPIAEVLGVPVLAGYLWLLPVGVLLAGGYSVFNYWSVRTKRFSTIASTRIRQSLATLAIQLAAFKLGGLALLLGQVAGQSVGTGSLARPALAVPAFRQVSWGGVWQAAVRYRRFPIFMTWAGLLNVGGSNLPPMLISSIFTVASAGFFSLAHRVVALPLSLVGAAVSQVYFSGAAEKHRDGYLADQILLIQRNLANIGMPLFLLIFLFAPDFFDLVFGEGWRIAGEMARWMSVWLYFQFCTSPVTLTYSVVGKQHLTLLMQIFLFVTRAASLLVGIYIGDILQTIILFSLVSSLAYIVFLASILHEAKARIFDALIFHFRSFVFSVICISPAFFVGFGFDGRYTDYFLVSLAFFLVFLRYFALINTLKMKV